MKDTLFTVEQYIERPRSEVFAFFSTPRNLEAITPPWLRFRMLDQSTNEIGEGTELTYRLRIRGLPVTWKSRIEEWRPGQGFVDVQVRGPYSKWHHTHAFEDHGSGTVIRDRVLYRLPLAPLGDWIAGGLVRSDVQKIFRFRRARTAELLERGSRARCG